MLLFFILFLESSFAGQKPNARDLGKLRFLHPGCGTEAGYFTLLMLASS